VKSHDVYHRWRITLFSIWVTLGATICVVAVVLLVRRLGL
jgi:hypothetical protein